MSDKKIIKVGSRKSKLAMIQTNTMIDKLKKVYDHLAFEVVTMTTVGDRILDSALSKIGEKSLFTKELEDSLIDGGVDFVVHSLKDLPTIIPEGLVIGCVNERDDPYDAVVMHPKNKDKVLETLPKGSVIGTSSLRRCAQIRRNYPHLKLKDIRGNLNTRFKKLDEDDMYDAIVLAVAGLNRMNWSERISQRLSEDVCMYAVSQGAIAIECRASDKEMLKILSPLHHRKTAIQCVAERAYLRKLEGGCTVPVSVFTEFKDDKLCIRGGVYSTEGNEAVEKTLDTPLPEPQKDAQTVKNGSRTYCSIVSGDGNDPDIFLAAENLGIALAEEMLKLGAGDILKVAKRKAQDAIEDERAKKKAKLEQGAVAVSS